MSREAQLDQPHIEWREPVTVTVIGRPSRLACRFCIALRGFKAQEWDEQQGRILFETSEQFDAHLSAEHSGAPFCERCGGSLAGRRSDARFCSGACRVAHYREGKRDPAHRRTPRDLRAFAKDVAKAVLENGAEIVIRMPR